jgi:hypothetical protein
MIDSRNISDVNVTVDGLNAAAASTMPRNLTMFGAYVGGGAKFSSNDVIGGAAAAAGEADGVRIDHYRS